MQKQQTLPIISAIILIFTNLLAVLFQPESYLVKNFLRDRTVSSIAKAMNSTTAPAMNIGSSICNSAKVIPMPNIINIKGKIAIICILLSLLDFYCFVII